MKQVQVPFPLKPMETATVSVISEATAAADIPAIEKINFHIGNPLQEKKLTDLYFEICTGYSTEILESDAAAESELPAGDLERLSQMYRIINSAVPYAPRNGFPVKNPPPVLQKLKNWLTAQEESLKYSFGEASPPEITLSNGGTNEFLRVLFTMFERFSVNLPLKLVTVAFELPGFINDFKSLDHALNISHAISHDIFDKIRSAESRQPFIVLIGRKLSEKERTIFWQLAEQMDILFCELVDLKNHQSLSRESGLQESVLRLLSARVLNKGITHSATHFVLGNSEIIKLFSAIHFELKGTPSATERDWLEYAVNYISAEDETTLHEINEQDSYPNTSSQRILNSSALLISSFSEKLQRFERFVGKNNTVNRTLSLKNLNNKWFESNYSDDLEFKSAVSLLPSVWQDPASLRQAFLNQFLKHHNQYEIHDCFVVSGSARTALSILGHHCGLNEIITFDWSWSYENGFNKVIAVPLFENKMLNSTGIKKAVAKQAARDPQWREKAAVVFNNPHNASGHVLEESVLKDLLVDLLEQDVFVIDDLSYQDVAPSRFHVKIKTLKELANEAVRNGSLQSDKLRNLITVHSLSKTDCFAGARLSVTEIAHPLIKKKFADIHRHIADNSMAVFLAYLFYRNENVVLKQFWRLRNRFFAERAESIIRAVEQLPEERNPFKIRITMPGGAMYPRMIIENFPQGISIDNISTQLSQRGIGLVPLTAFSKTARGYESGRKTFRLTLGGTDNAEIMATKTRRLLIELNLLLHEEAHDYQLLKIRTENFTGISPYFSETVEKWQKIVSDIEHAAQSGFKKIAESIQNADQQEKFNRDYLPWRLSVLQNRFSEQMVLYSKVIARTQQSNAEEIRSRLKNEFYKERIEDRQQSFKKRLFDRTVHPTQMYSLQVDILTDRAFSSLVYGSSRSVDAARIGLEIVREFLGLNIPVNSEQEASELIYDLRTLVRNELYSDNQAEYLLSFWGDWDGSTRPSGQGHRLVAAVLMENVRHMAYFLRTLYKIIPNLNIEVSLIAEMSTLLGKSKKFWQLLNKITSLTNQLEKSYRGLLPAIIEPGRLRKIAIKLKIRRDPLKILFSHNSRLEKRMLQLRSQRKNSLEYYFELNKALRKKLHDLIPLIVKNIDDPRIALLAGGYKNLLKRFVLTPRIHQKSITSADPFTIENTVHNLCEINQIGARFGNPGICLALQVSMSTNAEALIKLNRMVIRKRESLNKENTAFPIRDLWLIPLFEDQETIEQLDTYLDKIWSFAEHSRTIEQTTADRFKEITCEIFVAGSDLSQQVGQPKSLELFKQTKVFFYKWLAQKHMLGDVRIKLGCGEPIQRQGGYFSDLSGMPVLYQPEGILKNIRGLSRPAQKSLYYARSPLAGLHQGGDLRTIQSNASEHIFRFLNYKQRSQLFYHMAMLQKIHRKDLQRVAAMLTNTRLDLEEKGIDEIKRISNFNESPVFLDFVDRNTESFRQIIYGQDEDAVGIHVISYFISRMTPVLRDRPTVRPARESSQNIGQQIVERIAQTLPMSHHGSSLRAIGHNRSQSAILGISQVSTGLFRTLKIFQERYPGSTTIPLILSKLPVKEILNDLRMYQQTDMKYIRNLESAFNSGNTALRALYEDFEYMYEFIPLLQQALIAKQGLSAPEFFTGNSFKRNLIQYFRPDLAVLLQNDLFNTDFNSLAIKPTEVDPGWLNETRRLLEIPVKLSVWREKIWQLIENKIYHQVSSFVDLAIALTTISNTSPEGSYINISAPRENRLTGQLNNLLRGTADDSVRHLLYSVAEYISHLPADNRQLPIDTVRVINDIERIVKIDGQPLSANEQAKLRFYILEIARLAHENG